MSLSKKINFTKDDIITTDGYLEFCNKNNLCYIKTDFFYTGPMIWRGKKHPDRIERICVIGHSDYPLSDQISSNFDLIFGVNKIGENKNSFGIPLGITNDTDESNLHRIYGNRNIMMEVSEMDIEKKNLCYSNFNSATCPQERNFVIKLFNDKDWVKIGQIDNSLQGRRNFLTEVKSSKFVLCPRGNGIDTHRLWETLYMGSIPVVKYESSHENFLDLPILFLENWQYLSPKFLEEKFEEFSSKEWNYEKLKLSYWENFILSKIKN